MIKRGALLPLAFLFLVFPYLLLLRYFSQIQLPESAEFFWALRNSISQALGSTFVAWIIGSILMLGFFKVPDRFRALTAWALLSPTLFPPLFLLLAFLDWVNPFPVGKIGIIAIQGFMNAGVVAIFLSETCEQKLGSLSEAARAFGSSRFLFFRRAFGLIRGDFLSIGLFVFAISFVSFSIPFVVGGGRATTLEILIYEKIRISGNWGEALSLSLLQLLALMCFAFLPTTSWSLNPGRVTRLQSRGSALALGVVFLYVAFFAIPLAKGLVAGVSAISAIPGLDEEIYGLLLPSFLTALAVGLGCLGLFLIFSFGGRRNQLVPLFRGWIAPSTSLLGFAFLFAMGESAWIFYVMALILMFFPAVYRLGMDRQLEGLESQVEVARTLGAGDLQIWKKILVPQIWSWICGLSGVAALWSLGEFALGKVILAGPQTLALLSESLMSSYRIEAGLGVSALILVLGAVLFLFFWGLGHVRR